MTYHGRHRAEDITLDLTLDNLARYYAHQNVVARTRYTGHLGTPGRHEAPIVRQPTCRETHIDGRTCATCHMIEIRLMPLAAWLCGLDDPALSVTYRRVPDDRHGYIYESDHR